MGELSTGPPVEANAIDRHFRQRHDKNVSRKFKAVAKAIWPKNTAAHLATIAATNERTASRWLAGKFDPPAIVIAAIVVEITKRG